MSARNIALKVHSFVEQLIFVDGPVWRLFCVLWLFLWLAFSVGRCIADLSPKQRDSVRPNSLATAPERPWWTDPSPETSAPRACEPKH